MSNSAIWKYQVEVQPGLVELEVPKYSKLLHLNVTKWGPNNILQFEKTWIWVRVDPEMKETETWRFRWFGTGHPIPDDHKLQYVDTVLLEEGKLVLHLFQDLNSM